MLDLLFAVVALDQIQTVFAPKNIIYHDSAVPLRQKKWGQIFFKKKTCSKPVQGYVADLFSAFRGSESHQIEDLS